MEKRAARRRGDTRSGVFFGIADWGLGAAGWVIFDGAVWKLGVESTGENGD